MLPSATLVSLEITPSSADISLLGPNSLCLPQVEVDRGWVSHNRVATVEGSCLSRRFDMGVPVRYSLELEAGWLEERLESEMRACASTGGQSCLTGTRTSVRRIIRVDSPACRRKM